MRDESGTPNSDMTVRQQMFGTYQAEQYRRELANADSYDRAILTYASGALALSLSFGKELVPFQAASHLWLLFGSWAGWLVAILAVILSYMFAAPASRKQLDIAERYFLRGIEAAFDEDNRWNRYTLWANRTAGCAFIVAALLTIIFVTANTGATTMGDDKKNPETTSHVTVVVGDAATVASMPRVGDAPRTKAAPVAQMPNINGLGLEAATVPQMARVPLSAAATPSAATSPESATHATQDAGAGAEASAKKD